MKRYKWNKKEIKKQLEELKLKSTKESKKIYNIESDIEALEELIDSIGFFNIIKNTLYNNFTWHYIDKDKADEIIHEHCTNFQTQKMFDADEIILNSGLDYDIYKIKKIKIKKDKQISLAKDILKEFNIPIYKFDELLDPNNHILDVCFFTFSNNFYSLSDSYYMSIKYRNNLESYLSFIHELGHFAEYHFNENMLLEDNRNNYSEISSLFFELIAIDKLVKEGIITQNEAYHLHSSMIILNDINNYLKIYEIKENEKKAFKGNPENEPLYFYSLLIALDLYKQYKVSPKEAIKNVKHLLENINYKDEEELLKECNIKTNNENLQKHIKKIKRNI